MDDLTEVIAAGWFTGGVAELSVYPELGPFVYYIQCGAFVKIGTSINPESRVRQLERGGKAKRPSLWVGSPKLIAYMPGNVAKERELHRQFAATRDEGEWFLMTEDLIEHVDDTQHEQALAEVEMHHDYYQRKVEAGEWPAQEFDLAKIYQQHLMTKNRLDPEWLEALSA